MFAVVKTGGKQIRVAEGDIVVVEKLPGKAGETITLEDVLLVNDGKTTKVGTPSVAGASVTATILEQKRGDKIIVFKKQRRKGYRRTMGHRQELTVLKISGLGGTKKAAPKKAAVGESDAKEAKVKKAPVAKKAPAKKAPAKKAAPKKTTAKAKPAGKKAAAAKTKKS